jgi:hypothetical protein
MAEFATEFAKFRVLRPIADLICRYIVSGTPADLEQAIKDGWSLVGQVKREPKEKLLAHVDDILTHYPAVKAVVESLRQNPPAEPKSDGNDFLGELDLNKLVRYVTQQLPAHGAVLSHHMDWVASEISRVQELLR